MNITQYVRQYSHKLAIFLAAIFAAHLFALASLNHLGLRTQLTDLGHMEQALWSLSQGDIKMTVTDPVPDPRSRLEHHANIIFYVISPFYTLLPTPHLLFFTGALAIGLGSYFLYRLATRVTGNTLVALLFATALLINPMVQDTMLYDFHPLVLAIGLIPAIFFFAHKKSWTWYWVSVVLLLSIKEDMPLLIGALTPIIFFKFSRKQAVYTLIVSVAYWFTIMHIVPVLTDIPVAAYHFNRLGDLGDTPTEAIAYLITHPRKIPELFTQTKFAYLLYLFNQGGFLALLSPLAALVALPAVAQNVFLNTNWQARLTGVYYSGHIVTALYCAAVFGYTWIAKRSRATAHTILYLFAAQALYFSLVLSPLPYSLSSSFKDFGIYHDQQTFNLMKKLIPPDATLAAQANLGSHFSARPLINRPGTKNEVDYVIFHLADPAWDDNGLFFLRNKYAVTNDHPKRIKKYLDDINYGLIAHQSSFYLFKRDAPHTDTPELRNQIEADLASFKKGIGDDSRKYINIPHGKFW